ncbi:MAG: cytochrome C [Ignavibacteria bacterium]
MSKVLVPVWLACAWLASAAALAAQPLDNATCLSCHDGHKGALKEAAAGGERELKAVDPDKYLKSIHGTMRCVACHADIVDAKAPHAKAGGQRVAECSQCHEDMARRAQAEGKPLSPGMEKVAKNIAAYRSSFHARPNKEDPSHVNATCNDCHDTHSFLVPPKDTVAYAQWRVGTPLLCGEKCHTDELEDYRKSIHGRETLENGNLKAAVCVDCHTTHNIGSTSAEASKLAITANCGSCHKDNLRTYLNTYHGQVNRLGYAYTAKCYDCHGSHTIQKVDDPRAKVSPKNRLKTCRQCHNGKKDLPEATAGFASFGPHANAHDPGKYPQVWFAAKFMGGLLVFVFAYFWAHSLLWWYREFMDRKIGRSQAHVRVADLPKEEAGKQVRRFGAIWRLGHLVFALSVMVLILTGMAVFYSDTAWAAAVVHALGGPRITGLIHRVSAALMLGIFFTHIVGVLVNIARSWKTFRFFGPDSLIPRWKDFADAWGMFKWFVDKGPRPTFDRWTYWEKFDYWAVFWGMFIIGTSGVMMAFPHITARYLPGWVFNVAMLVHGEEAFLAAVFLFTVHFFNNHFRPDKLPPPDIVMFTGSQSVEEFRREHTEQYKRLVASGRLKDFLVDAPSQPMTTGSKVLGLILLAFGLTLLVLVAIGFFAEPMV